MPEMDLREPGGADPGMFATMLAIAITIFAFVFALFVSTVE